MALLSSNFHTTKKYIFLTVFLFLLQKFTDIDTQGTIPYINLNIPSKEDSLLLLTALSCYFFIRLNIDWYQSKQEEREKVASKFDFTLGLIFSSIPILATLFDFIRNTVIWDLPIVGTVVLLGIGEFIVGNMALQIINLKYIRTKEEALSKGLPRIPAAVRATFIFIPISVFIIFIIYLLAQYYFTEPLSLYWVYILCFPLLVHIPITLYEFLGDTEEFHDGIKKIFDSHDTRYQHGGWDKKAKNSITEFYKAAEEGNIEIVKEALKNAANPNEINTHGWSPFLISVAQGHEEVMNLCIDYGADVNQSNSLGRTGMMFSSRYGNTKFVKKLIEYGASINAVDSQHGTALMVASLYGHKNIVQLLLNNGADVSIKDFSKKTALDYAIENKHGNIAKLLRSIK